jgi:hypothetical protein
MRTYSNPDPYGSTVNEEEETLYGSWPLFEIYVDNSYPVKGVECLELLLTHTSTKDVAAHAYDRIAAFLAIRLAII